MICFVDLFCGIGGIRLALENALAIRGHQYKCVLSSDIDKAARETYSLNFGETPHGDIKEIKDVPDHSILLAGFPCQPFSYAGARRGFGDTRGTLFFEIERILQSKRPKLVLLENVRGLVTHDGGRTLQTILERLKSLNYGVEYRVLNSSDFGVPQNRMRLYIAATLGFQPKLPIASRERFVDTNKAIRSEPSLFDETPRPKVLDVLEDDVPPEFECSAQFVAALERVVGKDLRRLAGYRMIDHRNGLSIHSWDVGLKGKCTKREREFLSALVANRRRHVFGTHQDGKALSLDQIRTFFPGNDLDRIAKSLLRKGYLRDDEGRLNLTAGNMSFEVYKFLDPQSVSVTVVSSDAHKLGIVHNGCVRRLTPREVARLQGFPDDFKLNPQTAASYRQLGNSVSVPVVRSVLETLIRENPELGLDEISKRKTRK